MCESAYARCIRWIGTFDGTRSAELLERAMSNNTGTAAKEHTLSILLWTGRYGGRGLRPVHIRIAKRVHLQRTFCHVSLGISAGPCSKNKQGSLCQTQSLVLIALDIGASEIWKSTWTAWVVNGYMDSGRMPKKLVTAGW